jgi:hypothetical protein
MSTSPLKSGWVTNTALIVQGWIVLREIHALISQFEKVIRGTHAHVYEQQREDVTGLVALLLTCVVVVLHAEALPPHGRVTLTRRP